MRYTLQRLRGQPWRFAEPKSASGPQTVPLAAPPIAAPRAQRRNVAERRLKLGEAWQDYDLVFPSEIGTLLDGTNVLHAFKRILAKAGLQLTHLVHDLRRRTAPYLMAAGVTVRVVMEIMGWSQVGMVMRYQPVLPEVLDDAAARLEAFFPATGAASG